MKQKTLAIVVILIVIIGSVGISLWQLMPPPTHTLSVNSSPISSVSFTSDGVSHATPLSMALTDGSHTIAVPSTINSTGKTYNFVSWEDGSTNSTRAISLTSNMTITANYQEIALPSPITHTINISSSTISGVSFTLDGVSYTTPNSTTLSEGAHTVAVQASPTIDGRLYAFKNWEDGSINPTRTVSLTGNTSIVAYYQVATPFTIMDDLGRNVIITNYPLKRIVSLAPGTTEILFALGLGDKIVGVDSYSDYPPEAKDVKPKVGSFASISIETVTALNPDLVLATGGIQVSVVDKLEGGGLTVVALNPKDVSGIISDITLVGKITGQENVAKALVNKINAKIQEISNKLQNAPRPRVYIEYYFNGGYWSFGSQALISELVFKAGGINVFSGFAGAYLSTSTEQVIKANPEIIIITNGTMAKAAGLTPDVIRKRAGWDSTSAVKNNQIYVVEESPLTRPGPRILDALETLSRLIHPELFSSG